MYYKFLITLFIFLLASCSPSEKSESKISDKKQVEKEEKLLLTKQQAQRLILLPLDCIQKEYPNKLGQVVGGDHDLQSPQSLHPAFYGCFDWHSAVHGHWSLVRLIKKYPDLEGADRARAMLKQNISAKNILKEVEYFKGKHNKSYERTYGWAWLLKLAEELHSWDDDLARELEQNLQPLTDLIEERYLEFLPKLVYPIRVGEHTNTAFGLSFAYDYAITLGREDLKTLIEKRAKEYYSNDEGCPVTWEPSGFDFLSPCLEEANIMSKVLPKDEFLTWMDTFLPSLADKNFEMPTGKVSDRSDGKLVHLDGVNFSRAWCFYNIASIDDKYSHLINLGNEHIHHSLPSLVGDSYEGGHWLGTFAIYALD